MKRLLFIVLVLSSFSLSANAEDLDKCTDRCVERWARCNDRCNGAVICIANCAKEKDKCFAVCEKNSSSLFDLFKYTKRAPTILPFQGMLRSYISGDSSLKQDCTAGTS